jgi:ribonuclease HII
MIDYIKQANSKGFSLIVGIDEAGRGPLAGPVVAAAVSLKKNKFENKIKDSKKMTSLQREAAYLEIFDHAYIGVSVISESIIDEINILEATYVAMNQAVSHLFSSLPQELAAKKNLTKESILLVDGNRFKTDLPYQYETIVDGDDCVLPIACASIIAKVTRDRILNIYDQVFPQYGFKQHKGYPTEGHRQAIRRFGPTIIHRKSFSFK